MPLAVRQQRGLFRIIDLDTGGIAKRANGEPLDDGGGASEAVRERLEKQAQAINISKMERLQRQVEAARAKGDRRPHGSADGPPPKGSAAAKRAAARKARMKEEAEPLPVLELSGTEYAIRLADAGMPAALVVEDPEAYTGKRFRFAEGDGFRLIELGAAAGPFHSLMSLPPYSIRGLDATRLRELGDVRDLYLVEVVSAAKLREEAGDGVSWFDLGLVAPIFPDHPLSCLGVRILGADEGEEVRLIVKGDASGLVEMLKHIGKLAGHGHSFNVVVDPDDREFRRSFGMDGDGPFRVEIAGTGKVASAPK